MMVSACLLAFISGATYESVCVFWVHNSEKGNALATTGFSMLAALAEVVGLGESIHDPRVAPFFVLGYGVGTYVSVTIKRRWLGAGK